MGMNVAKTQGYDSIRENALTKFHSPEWTKYIKLGIGDQESREA